MGCGSTTLTIIVVVGILVSIGAGFTLVYLNETTDLFTEWFSFIRYGVGFLTLLILVNAVGCVCYVLFPFEYEDRPRCLCY